jgi:predicted dinucleotide-binding enzyme
MMKKVAVLGTGEVGQRLAAGLIQHGYSVVMGTANPGKVIEPKDASVKNIITGTMVTTYENAVSATDAAILAVKGTASEDVVRSIREPLGSRIVMDTTNPIAPAPPQNGVLKFFTSLDDSLMERLQRAAPQARFVKAFSCVGNAQMVNPDFSGVRPTMFICGNDAAAKKEVTALLEQFGHEVEDMGGVEASRAIEPLCILWCIPGFLRNQWTHAFKLLKQ